MKSGLAWTLAIVLTALPLFLMFGYIPRNRSEVAKRGVREEGTVLKKDSRTAPDGNTVYTVSYTFLDSKRQNHTGSSVVDQGVWDSLKPQSYVRVYYLPENPDKSQMINALEGEAPNASALRFLAWTMLLVSPYFWARAVLSRAKAKAQAQPPDDDEPEKPSAKITMARR